METHSAAYMDDIRPYLLAAGEAEPGADPVDLLSRVEWMDVGGGRAKLAEGGTVHLSVAQEVTDQGARVRRFVISDSEINRRRDRVMTDGIDTSSYMQNPVVLYQHDAWSRLPIGRTVRMERRGDQMVADIELGEGDFEDKILSKVDSGIISATSIGIRIERMELVKERSGYDILECDLMEISIVSVPCNQRALRTMQADGLAPSRSQALSWLSGGLESPDVELMRADVVDALAKKLGVPRADLLSMSDAAASAVLVPDSDRHAMIRDACLSALGLADRKDATDRLSVAGVRAPWESNPDAWERYSAAATLLKNPTASAMPALLAAAGLENEALIATVLAEEAELDPDHEKQVENPVQLSGVDVARAVAEQVALQLAPLRGQFERLTGRMATT